MVRSRRGRVKNGTWRHPRGPDPEATGENPPECKLLLVRAAADSCDPAKRYGMSRIASARNDRRMSADGTERT
jgi:hypothetical protein